MAQSHHAPGQTLANIPAFPRMLCASMAQRELYPIMHCDCMAHREGGVEKPQSHHALRLGKKGSAEAKRGQVRQSAPFPTMLCATQHSPVPPDLGRGGPVPSGHRSLAAQAQTRKWAGSLQPSFRYCACATNQHAGTRKTLCACALERQAPAHAH